MVLIIQHCCTIRKKRSLVLMRLLAKNRHMSTFRQDPEDRDSARVAGDNRALRQRISTGLLKRRRAVKVESPDGASRPAVEPLVDQQILVEDAPALVDDRELVSQ